MGESNPVPVRCTLPDGAIFDVLAVNISQQGLRFFMTDSPPLPHVGDCLRLTFDTCELKGLSTTATIQHRAKILDMVRFGLEFTEVPEGGQQKLAEYEISEKSQAARGTEQDEASETSIIFVVDEPQERDRYSFLDRNFKVIHSDSFDVIGRLLTALPEAILFNSSLPDGGMVLQILTSHPILKGIPVIEIQKKKRQNPGNVFSSLPFPMDEFLVLDTLYQAIAARKIAGKLREDQFSGPFKTGISILLVDDSSASGAHDIEALRSLNCDVKRIDNLKLLYDSFVWSTPDVIAIDENTREIDACTVCRLLNMNRELKDVPKLLLSEKRTDRHSNRSVLFSSVMTKPFTARQLLNRAHYLLSRSSR